MPEPLKHVQYNHEGSWMHAIVWADRGGNLDLSVKRSDEGGWEDYANVPEGDGNGHWREPK